MLNRRTAVRRRVTVCREGVYYVLVLIFIIGGATARDLNLLFILAGMMVGPLLFNWRFVVQTLRNVSVSRRLPDRIFAGEPFRVEIRGQNDRRRLGCWMLAVEDCVQPERPARESSKLSSKPNAGVILGHIGAGGSGAAAYQVTLPCRGRYRFGPLWVSTRFPMGLVKGAMRCRQYERAVAWPRLGRLLPGWRELLTSRHLGHHTEHHQQGPMDGDYFSLREWRSGDSKRWIHWRTSARLGTLAVRQFEQQQDETLALVLDLWTPAKPRDEDLQRVEVAVSLAATLVDELARRGHGRLSFALAARQPGHWEATAGPLFARQMFERLAMVEAALDNHLAEAFSAVTAGNSTGIRVTVISTRSNRPASGGLDGLFPPGQRRRSLADVVWLDVGTDEARRVFAWDEP